MFGLSSSSTRTSDLRLSILISWRKPCYSIFVFLCISICKTSNGNSWPEKFIHCKWEIRQEKSVFLWLCFFLKIIKIKLKVFWLTKMWSKSVTICIETLKMLMIWWRKHSFFFNSFILTSVQKVVYSDEGLLSWANLVGDGRKKMTKRKWKLRKVLGHDNWNLRS